MPDSLQTHIQLYTSSIQQIEVHLRRALIALEALGRHPPSVYLQELESTADDDSASEILLPTADELLPGRTIHLPPITRHNLSNMPPTARVLQHNSVQTTPTHYHSQSIQTDTIIDTLLLHEEQQTTPQPEPWSAATQTDNLTSHATAQTELHSIVRSPAFATPNPLVTPTTPTTTNEPRPTANIVPPPAAATSLSNKQPNPDPARWCYANFIPTPPVDQFPAPAGPTEVCSQGKPLLFKHLQIFGLFAIPFPHLPSHRGN